MVAQYDELVGEIDEAESERDEARKMYNDLAQTILHLYFESAPKQWVYADPHQAVNAMVRHLNGQRDDARRWSEVWKEERDEARRIARQLYKRTMFLEAVNDLSLDTTNRAQDLAGRLLKFAGRLIIERDDARARLRQLLHALDNQSDGDGNTHLSWNVRAQMRQARRLLKEGDRDQA